MSDLSYRGAGLFALVLGRALASEGQWIARGTIGAEGAIVVDRMTIDKGLYDPVREGVPLEGRPATLGHDRVCGDEMWGIGINEYKIGIVVLPDEAPILYAEELGWTVSHHLYDLLPSEDSLQS